LSDIDAYFNSPVENQRAICFSRDWGNGHHKKDNREPGLSENANDSAYVEFDRVQKSYDGEILVVKDLNLALAKGEFLTMLGPSGSGKTTCLMMLAGF